MVYGEEYKAMWILLRSSSGARNLLFLAALCFDNCTAGRGAFLVFIIIRAVFVQNMSHSSPLLRMKLVISQKAWYMTALWRGMVVYKWDEIMVRGKFVVLWVWGEG